MDLQIETKRLKLKLLTEDDLDDLVQLNLAPEVSAFFPDGVQNTEQRKKSLLELIYTYNKHRLPGSIMVEKGSNSFLGRYGFSPTSHIASQRVMEKCGTVFRGALTK